MTSLRIIIETVFLAIVERLKVIRLFRGRRRNGNLSTSLYRDRRSLAAHSELSRGHPAIVLHAPRRMNSLCSSTMRCLTFALGRVHRTLGIRVVRCSFKETTAKRYQNKNRYDMPRGRGRTPGKTVCRLQIKPRSIATGSADAKENAA